jgi:hypothetical protein
VFTIEQLLLIAALSVVVALGVLVAKLTMRMKLDWSWVFAGVVTLLVIGCFALWVAAQISASV